MKITAKKAAPQIKRGRGRPRKDELKQSFKKKPAKSLHVEVNNNDVPVAKKPRGRPPKAKQLNVTLKRENVVKKPNHSHKLVKFLAVADNRKSKKEQISRSFKCKLCDKNYKYPDGLKRHLLTHSEDKPHECDVCGKRFQLFQYLDRHLKTHIWDQQKEHGCQDCPLRLYTFAELMYHRKSHGVALPFGCGACGKSFSRKEGLRGHSLTHLKARRHTCIVCKAEFLKYKALRIHQRTEHPGHPDLKVIISADETLER